MVRLGICLTVVLGSLSVASAESYVSLGVGGEPSVHGDLRMAANGEGDGGNGRLALGLEYRLSAPLLGQAGIWAEVSDNRLDAGGGNTGGVRLWTAGLIVGL